MYVSMPVATFTAAANLAGLVAGVDYAAVDKGAATRILPLSMHGVRFLIWETASNGQPGLGVDVPPEDLDLLRTNMIAVLAGKLTAWTQT